MVRKSAITAIITTILLATILILMAILPTTNTNNGSVNNFFQSQSSGEHQLIDNFAHASDGYLPCALAHDRAKYSLDSSFDNWQVLPLFGENTLYLGLDTTKANLYDQDFAYGKLTTPQLTIFENDYSLSFDYFTLNSQNENTVRISCSLDGQNFVTAHTTVLSFEQNSFSSVSIELPFSAKYIAFEFAVWADTSATKTGVYLTNIALTAQNESPNPIEEQSFSVTFADTPLIYDGNAKTPDFELLCTEEQAQYYYYSFVSNLATFNLYAQIDAINAGEYYFHIVVFSQTNQVIATFVQSFEIGKATLSFDNDMLSYGIFSQYFIVYNLPIFDNLDIDYVITDSNVRTSKLNVIEIDSVPFDFHIEVAESANFLAFSSQPITISTSPSSSLCFYVENARQQKQYNGQEQGLDYGFFYSAHISGEQMSPDFELEPTEDFEITYSLNGVPTTPKNVGVYTANVVYHGTEYNFELQITPKVIENGIYIGQAMHKVYDGSNSIYYTYKESLEDTQYKSGITQGLKGHDFALNGIINEDKLSLIVPTAQFNFNFGKVKVLLSNLSLNGTDSTNYILSQSFTTNFNNLFYDITKATLSLAPLSSGTNALPILNKTYDGTTDAEIDYNSIENTPITFLGLAQIDNLDITKLSATFLSPYAGSVAVSLAITDSALLQKYHSNISLDNLITPLTGEILPRELEVDINSSNITIESKIYSGDKIANITFDSCTLNTPLPQDIGIINNHSYYQISYGLALFAQANAGENIDIFVSDIAMNVLDSDYFDIISSYSIANLTLKGNIDKKQLDIVTEHLIIAPQTHIPEISVVPSGVSVSLTYYAHDNLAQPLSSAPSTSGEYYIKVTSDNNNYFVDNSTPLILLTITTQKLNQTILFDGIDNFIADNKITLILGAKFDPRAYSVVDSGEKNYLHINYSSPSLTINDNIIIADTVGDFVLTATQSGNDFYNSASALLDITVVNVAINLSSVQPIGFAYIGYSLPQLTGNAKVGANTINSSFCAVEDTVTALQATYTYILTFEDTYAGSYLVDYNLSAIKPTLEVNLPHTITKIYAKEINILDYATVFIVRDGIKTLASEFDLTLTPNIDLTFLAPDNYTFDFDGGEYSIATQGGADYNIDITTLNLSIVVEKSLLVVSASILEKYYGQNLPYLPTVSINGYYDNSHLQQILDTISFGFGCDKYSAVGSYAITMQINNTDFDSFYDFIVISSYIIVKPTPITISTNTAESVYKNPLSSLVVSINGLYINSDYDYLKDYVKVSLVGATSNSNIGNYTVLVSYQDLDSNYTVTVQNGTYRILPAPFVGITFEDKKYVYDGKEHSLLIEYDQTQWGELDIVYNISKVKEVGVYTITATVKKDNYTTTVYTAKLTISTLNLVSSFSQNKIEIIDLAENSQGFSPDITLSIMPSTLPSIEDAVNSKLQNLSTKQETIVGIYDIVLTQDNQTLPAFNGEYKVKLSLSGITSSKNIRILANIDGELTEVDYTFSNGEFVFVTHSLNGIAVLKTTQITQSSLSTIVVASMVGVVVLVVIAFIFNGFGGQRKKRLRTRKKYRKWI